MCKSTGATTVAVVGRRGKEHLELAKKLGADVAINTEELPDVNEGTRIIKDFLASRGDGDVMLSLSS